MITTVSLFFSFTNQSIAATLIYTLENIEKKALEKAPELEQISNRKFAWEESSISSKQLKNPKLNIGLINVPTDSFNLTQENMTQFKIGIIQEFPRGRSLSLASEQEKFMARSESYQYVTTQADIIKAIRINWIELYYLLEARKILKKSKSIFVHLIQATTSKLAAGKGFQHDVLKAQIELTQVENQLIQNKENLKKIRAILARFVGKDIAGVINPKILPRWRRPISEKLLHEKIIQHPSIQKDDALIMAAQKRFEISKELYKPAWSLGVTYALRQGHTAMNLKKRSGFVGIQLSTELPFFTSNRQDRKVAASSRRYQAAKNQKLIDLLNLSQSVSEFYAMWDKLEEQRKLYKKRFVPEAEQYAEATLHSYENIQIAFDIVARAHNKLLLVLLQQIRIDTQKYKILAYLMYLEGDIS